MKNILFIFLFILAISCKDTNSGYSEVWVHNQSNQLVKLYFTSGISGYEQVDSTITLGLNSKHLLRQSDLDASGPVSFSIPIELSVDTCRIIFNDSVYLIYDAFDLNKSRNFMRVKTFDTKEISESKKITKREFWFYITEQDFLNAEPL